MRYLFERYGIEYDMASIFDGAVESFYFRNIIIRCGFIELNLMLG
jgi:hypothetical protein